MTEETKQPKYKNLYEMHKFFLKESKSYMEGTPRLKYYLRFPIVYIKFMKFYI
jgi:hypothetical protein